MSSVSLRARDDLAARYGAWAVVAGASEGLGEAFARALAARGLHLVLLARRGDVLESLATGLRDQHRVEVHVHALDLARPSLAADLDRVVAGLDVGVAVYNAAFAPVGELVSRPLDDLLRAVDVNVRGPVVFARALAPGMVERGRGALVLMSSLAGNVGTPRLATYAATKAFNTVLAEGLWGELRGHGVDVVACCAGAVRTPGYQRTASGKDAPGTLDPDAVAETTLASLGRGPRIVPGFVNRVAHAMMTRMFTRRSAVATMARSTKELSES